MSNKSKSIVPAVSVFFFLFAVALLIVSSILSAYASSEAEKKNTATAQKWSMWSSILSGLGIVIIIISSVALALSWAMRDKGQEEKLGNLVKNFANDIIVGSDYEVKVPIRSIVELKDATDCYIPSEKTTCVTKIAYKPSPSAPAQRAFAPQPPAIQPPPPVVRL